MAATALLLAACNPEPKWETKDVKVNMHISKISSGFVECDFSTDKDAYYLIGAIEPWEDFNPVYNQKQFMQLALDYAYADYLTWRNELLLDKEFNVATFASHSLQYGNVHHFFTGLTPGDDYWVYAFAVDPDKMQPAGFLTLEPVTMDTFSMIDIRFEYRIKNEWSYIYPTDSLGKINSHYPYIALTRDSAVIAQDTLVDGNPYYYFMDWEIGMFLDPDSVNPYYGVKAIDNDGTNSPLAFEEGHTYYTGITGFDGIFKHMAIYKFTWRKGCELYFYDTDSTNLVYQYADQYPY